jgi:hypothetical protein
MTTIDLPILSNKRECGTCTKCCEGWLSADIKGHKMFPGKPCFFIEQGVGCKDYEGRPEDPCKDFECGWKQIVGMPDEFRPELSGTIMSYRERTNSWTLNKAPNNPSIQFLSWALLFVLTNGYNFVWYIDDQIYWIGSDEFCLEMKRIKNNER